MFKRLLLLFVPLCLSRSQGVLMKLRALITIDIDADDFIDAAAHQRQVEAMLSDLRAKYPAASLVFRERRQSARAARRAGAASVRSSVHSTGRLSTYVD